MDQDSALRVFTELYLADLERDRVRTLDEYQRLFPGHAEPIAMKFSRLRLDTPLPRREPAADDSSVFIGPYRLERVLGQGGQGEVHLATDVRLQREVALKTLHGIAGDASRRALHREATLVASLDHPNICAVYEVGAADGIDFIAMRYVRGKTLAQRFDAQRATPSRERARALSDWRPAVQCIETCARALHAAHTAGLVHRDVKPGNILIGDDGEPVLLDFGLARLQESEGLTTIGRTVGTPAYMAPEQVRGERNVDQRIDIWALGAVLYEHVTLRRPFDAPTREALWRAILGSTPVDPRLHIPSLPRDLCSILSVAMHPEPDRRYATALDFADDLQRLRAGMPIHARPPSAAQRAALFVKRNRLASALTTALLVVLSGALVNAVSTNTDLSARRREAETSAGEAKAALGEAQWRADRALASDFIARERDLYPIEPAMIPRFEAWLDELKPLASRLPQHRERLAAMKTSALAPDAVQRSSTYQAGIAQIAQMEEARSAYEESAPRFPEQSDEIKYLHRLIGNLQHEIDAKRAHLATETVFADENDQRRFNEMRQLVADLETLVDETNGTTASVRRRIERTRDIERRSLVDCASVWQRAIADIAADPRYGGLRLAPQFGLVPIGKDPDSGLQEFLDLHTQFASAPPERTETGALAMTVNTGVVFVLLPGGTFTMGSTAEQYSEVSLGKDASIMRETPSHQVTLDPFFISKYELTQSEYVQLMEVNPSGHPVGKMSFPGTIDASHPVEMVSWNEAQRALHRAGLELPTEAQWEYAARGGTSTIWWTGDDYEALVGAVNLADKAAVACGYASTIARDWPDLDDGCGLHTSAFTMRPNPFGLHHVYGNVSEWTLDVLGDYRLSVHRGTGERFGSHAQLRLTRGGSYLDSWPTSRNCCRVQHRPDDRTNDIGVRPARRIDP